MTLQVAVNIVRPPRLFLFFLFVVDNGLLATAYEMWDEFSGPLLAVITVCFVLVHVCPGLFWKNLRGWVPGPLVFAYCFLIAVVPATIIEWVAGNLVAPFAAKCCFVAVCAVLAALLNVRIVFARPDPTAGNTKAG